MRNVEITRKELVGKAFNKFALLNNLKNKIRMGTKRKVTQPLLEMKKIKAPVQTNSASTAVIKAIGNFMLQEIIPINSESLAQMLHTDPRLVKILSSAIHIFATKTKQDQILTKFLEEFNIPEKMIFVVLLAARLTLPKLQLVIFIDKLMQRLPGYQKKRTSIRNLLHLKPKL